MAVYKVIQDIEAEDRLLGPLTLKGFIYALIAGTCAFIEFRLLLIGTPLKWLFIIIFAIPMILFGVLASPLGREQPTEVWLLSRIRFFLMPRSRTWDQAGMQELVTVTVPKKEERQLTKNLSQSEVQSRLKTLAMTLDTRGWAVKNVNVNLNEEPKAMVRPESSSDRLVSSALPREMPVVDVHPADDILDEQNNPTAQKFEAMMQKAADERRQSVRAAINDLAQPNETARESKKAGRRQKSKKTDEQEPEDILASRIQAEAEKDTDLKEKLSSARAKFTSQFVSGRKKADTHHRLVGTRPAAPVVKAQPAAVKPPSAPVTAANQAVNMELAQSGSAFSVATLSRLANRQPKIEQTGPNEVTISLH